MDDYTKYIILSHLYWIENGITEEEISKSYTEIKNKDIFSGVKMNQIQENMGYKVNYKEVITKADYDKITFLWLSLSKFSIDLSFVKFCTNLEEINIGCFNEVNLDSLIQNTKLKKIIANSNKITNIESLYAHKDLEYINIQDNPCISLKPIAHLNKMKELKVGLIDDEKFALNILKNNQDCNIVYLIKGGEIGIENIFIPYFHFMITKDKNQIEIHIEGVEDTSSWPVETKIPECILNSGEIFEKILDKLSQDISNRLKIILDKPIVINHQNSYTFGNSYHLNYTHIF